MRCFACGKEISLYGGELLVGMMRRPTMMDLPEHAHLDCVLRIMLIPAPEPAPAFQSALEERVTRHMLTGRVV